MGVVRIEEVVLPVPAADPPGEPTAFAQWVAPHIALLTALAAREVGRADADDVVQDALVRAWRRRSTFRRDRGTSRVWLVAVLLDQARRHRVRRPLDTIALSEDAEAHTPGDDAEASGQRIDLDRAVRSLPRRQREVITLFYLADLSIEEISDVLHIRPGTVKSQLSDARAALRARLEQ